MTCYIRMKRTFLQGLLWLYLFGFGFMALSLEPGFLDFDNLPDTNFTCVGKVIGGYYADLETNCQMFHVCTIGQLDEPMDIRFLCLNGTVFDQETRVCERIDEVDCTKSEQFYSLNLELYGNSQPSNLEEISETEQPLIIKSTLPTTTTTTEPTRKTTRTPYYTTVTSPTTGGSTQQLISAHHFSLINANSPDIRFNPEEINISLHPGAPPDIRTKPHLFYSDKKESNSEKTVVVTTHRSVVSTHRSVYEDGGREANTQKSLSGYNQATPGDINFGFTLRNADVEDYNTEDSEADSYHYHTEFRPSQEYSVPHHNPQQRQSQHQPQQYTSSTFRNEYTPTTSHNNNNYQSRSSTTARNQYIESLKPPARDQQNQYHHPQSEKTPQRLQLPLPLLPTLPPLTFSSPAPFSLQQRFETKRYTKDHFPPPRIVVSASASVSDASGRRLNYSLGTIGTAPLFKHPPTSYDEYKDEDVGLDPFYHDVQKVKSSRKRRSLPQSKRRRRSDRSSLKHSDIIKNDDDAIHVLKFLFDWYRHEKTNPARFTTPISAPLNREGIVSINDELSPEKKEHSNLESDDDNIDFKFKTSDVFNKKSRYSRVGDGGSSINQKEVKKINNVKEEFTIMQNEDPENGDEIFQHEEDYVNDNFEPVAYRNNFENDEKKSRGYKHEFNGNVGRHDYKYKYANEKEHPVDYVDEFSKEAGLESSHPNKYENEPSPDYEREFNKERERGHKVEHVSTTFDDESGNDTNYTVPNEYIDDNIEPIYYRERNDQREFEEKTDETKEETQTGDSTTETFGPTEIIERKSIIDTISEESTLSFSKLPGLEETTTEYYQEQAITQDNNDVNLKLSWNITTSTTPSVTTEITSHPTTISADEFETTLTTETPTTTTSRLKNSRRRGRRKYHSAEAKDKEIEFKKSLIEKLIKKPVRAKDDYDFLRTVHVHTTTTGEGLDGNSFTEMNTEAAAPINAEHESVHFVPTLTEKSAVTERSSSETTTRSFTQSIDNQKETEPESKFSEHVFLTTSSTTVTSINSKRRRGKQRTYVDSNRKKSSRRRKPTKSTESNEYYPSSNITYLGSVEIIPTTPLESVSSESIGSISVLEKNSEPTRNSPRNENEITSHNPVDNRGSGNDDDIASQNHTQVSVPHLEFIETTTDHVKAPKLGRGKTKFLHLTDLDQQSTVIDITRTTPISVIEQDHLITTESPATTEHSTEGFEKAEDLYSGSTSVYGKDNIASSERIEDIYATSFVPTTESIHITKKKQLEDNLLNSDLFSTTESSLDINTVRITDVTEEFNEETTFPTTAMAQKRLELIEEVEITTGSYLSDLTTTDVEEFERTTASSNKSVQDEAIEEAHLLRNDSVPILSKGVNLLSIVVEEKVEDDPPEESTTDLDFTTNIPHEVVENTEGYMVTDATTEDRASSYFESSTESLVKVAEVKEDTTVDQLKFDEEYKTEPLIPTTEVIPETSSDSVETKAPEASTATTLAVETTTIATDYSQIPTTFEQTTFAPVTTERTTTMRSHSRKERPNRRRPNQYRSSYRHRFSSEYTTRKPGARKQATENEIRFSSEYTTRKPGSRKQAIDDEIIDGVSRKGKQLTTGRTTDTNDTRESLTEYPLMKSVHPTQAERTLVTTPFSRKTTIKKHFFFNCFGKPVDKFYPDLRDCRLFHYCTQGYNKNQLLDMKFVCDLNTFFDDEKLICTKIKPKRCL